VPPGGRRAAELPDLQLVGGLVEQSEERTHGDDPRQVGAAHLDADAHLNRTTVFYTEPQRLRRTEGGV